MKRDILLIVFGVILLLAAVTFLDNSHKGNPYIALAGAQ